MNKSETRLLSLWALLVVITLVSLETIHVGSPRAQGIAVILFAFIKVRLIILDFMEIRHAPTALRVMLEIWIVAACGGLIGLLVTGI
jgi:hypothetical protein